MPHPSEFNLLSRVVLFLLYDILVLLNQRLNAFFLLAYENVRHSIMCEIAICVPQWSRLYEMNVTQDENLRREFLFVDTLKTPSSYSLAALYSIQKEGFYFYTGCPNLN